MKNIRLLSLLILAVALSACAKRDSEFAARYAKNRAGAQVVDGPKAEAAGEQAAAVGIEADIVGVEKYFSDMATSYGPYIIRATLLLNSSQVPITMSHTGLTKVEGVTTIEGYTVVFRAICLNTACEPYYSSMEVYQNNVLQIQVGLKKHFNAALVDADRYQFFQPQEAKPLVGTSNADTNGLVGYLNSGSSGATGTPGTGLIQ